MWSELLRSQQKIAVVQQENDMFRKSIEELESVSMNTSTPASPTNMPLDQPAGILDSHLLDPVVFLIHLGNFTEDETWWALSQSNNNTTSRGRGRVGQ
jgi:hypothetical protein